MAELQHKAVIRTYGYSGPGVDKPSVSVKKTGSRRYVLRVSQHFDSAALLTAHYPAFDPAILIENGNKKPGGPTIESLLVVKGRRFADGIPPVSLTHQRNVWKFSLNLAGSKAYDTLQYESSANPGGVYHSGTVKLEFHVQLPGTLVSTNGHRLSHGVISWNLLALKSPVLTATSRG